MKQSTKTLLLWGLLILMFVGIWQFLTPPAHPGATVPAVEPVSIGSWLPSLLGCGAIFTVFFVLARFGQATRANNAAIIAANGHLGAGRLDEAERAIAPLATSRLPHFRRMVFVERALIATWRADRDGALAELAGAFEEPRGRLFRKGVENAVLQARSVRAFLLASAGDAAGARSDLAAVRAKPDVEPVVLARASLAEARLLDQAGDRAGLGALLDRDRGLLRHATAPRERALVRAYEAMLEASAASVYRQRADRLPQADEAREIVAWVTTFAPNAGPFVQTPSLPTGNPGDMRAEAPSEAARRDVAATKPQGVKARGSANAVVVWAVFIGIFAGVWGWYQATPGLQLPILLVVAAGAFVGVAFWTSRRMKRSSRDAKVVASGFRALSRGELPTAPGLVLEANTPMHRLQVAHVLAEAALRRGDPAGALEQVEHAYLALAEVQGGKVIAPVAPAEGTRIVWDYPRILAAQRSFALAMVGRTDEAWAEIEWAKGFPDGHAVFRVLLVTRLGAGDFESAAQTIEARDPGLLLPLTEEVLAEMARFVGRPALRSTDVSARIRAELRRDRTLAAWIDAIAPRLRPAFEQAAAETDAGIPAPEAPGLAT